MTCFVRWRRGVMLAAMAAATACVDSPDPASPADQPDDPLAQTFDALSRESSVMGDLARTDGFAFAALSVRAGVTPSTLVIRNGPNSETLDAFVSAVDWESTISSQLRPPARRTLVAWRRNDGLLRVLSMHTPGDSALIQNPLALGVSTSTNAVYAGATAMYQEVGSTIGGQGTTTPAWYGVTGWVKIKEGEAGANCTTSLGTGNARLSGVKCTTARYILRFDIGMQRMSGRPLQLLGPVTPRPFAVPNDATVNGFKLRFSCIAPSSTSGC